MQNNYTVYMHTVLPNGKKYVGITRQPIQRRWGGNGCAYTKSQYFAKAIAKYGWENIKHEILFSNLSKSEAEAKEVELIAKFDLTNHALGYNIAKGGGGTAGVKASKETRKKLSDAHKNGKRPRSIPILCLTTGVVYSSIGEAAEKTGCCKGGIRDCLCGRKKQTHNLRFDYADEADKKPKIKTRPKKEVAAKNGLKAIPLISIPVEQYDLEGNFVMRFSSIKEATKFVGGKSNHISGCLNGKRKTAFGYIWKKASKTKEVTE